MPDNQGETPAAAGDTADRLRNRLATAIRRFRQSRVRWGSLRTVVPVSTVFGLDRGLPVDRYYIEGFLREHRSRIRGRVLEIGDATYTRRFGGDRVTESVVLHAVEGNPEADLVGSLETGQGIPECDFDCVILTQTLHVIFDVRSAIASTARALRPGGSLLATVPGISQISRYDMERWGDYWRFTSRAARRLFEASFPPDRLTVEVYGNVLAATAFLQGVSAGELSTRELDHRDPDYEVLIGVVAERGGEP